MMKDVEKRLTEILKIDQIPVVKEFSNSTAAAVLILLVKVDDEWNIVFTRRTNGVRTHQGEVSFPGGSYEQGDKDLTSTALRETFEEIGVEPDCVKILGGLNPTKTISGYCVFPFIGILKSPPVFTMNHEEVERTFLVPVRWLMNDDNIYEKDHILNGQIVKKVIHFKDFDGEHLWGLTARMTKELVDLIK